MYKKINSTAIEIAPMCQLNCIFFIWLYNRVQIGLLFNSSRTCKKASTARNWRNTVPQEAATTFAFSSLYINPSSMGPALLPSWKLIGLSCPPCWSEWGGAERGGAAQRRGGQPGEEAPVTRQQPQEWGGPVPGQGQEGSPGGHSIYFYCYFFKFCNLPYSVFEWQLTYS